MPNFSIKEREKPTLKANILKIAYAKPAHIAYLEQLKSTVNTLNSQQSKTKYHQTKTQMILLGAVLFTQARIQSEYTNYLGFSPSGSFLTKGSELSKALNEIPQMEALSAADDNILVQTFALQAFNQWYNQTAFHVEENDINRIVTNPLCQKGTEYEQFEPILKNLTKNLPEITDEHFAAIKALRAITDSGYSMDGNSQSNTAGSRGWGEFVMTRPVVKVPLGIANSVATAVGLNFWSAPEVKEKQDNVEEKVVAEEAATAKI